MPLLTITLSAIWIIAGTVLFLQGYFYESGTICFWMTIATLTWPSVQRGTAGGAWRLLGWFHLHLVPLFLIAHVAGCRMHFWVYESTYLLMLPHSLPLIGGVPLFEFFFYTVFTAAVIGIYFFTKQCFTNDHPSRYNLLLSRLLFAGVWLYAASLVLLKPNPDRLSPPLWCIIMAGSSLPFTIALMGIPPLNKALFFVIECCSRKSFLAFALLLFSLMAFWELSAIRSGLWVYNKSMQLSFITELSGDGTRTWPVDMLFGHSNTAIIVFLTVWYQKRRR